MPLPAIRHATLGLLGLCLIALPGLPAHPQPNTTAPGDGPVTTPVTGIVSIESDLQKADNATGILTATGNVRILYPDQRVVATARQAQYFSREGRLVLSGDVDVVQGDGHSIRAEQLTYLVQNERLLAQPSPGEQVITRYRLDTTPPAATPAGADLPPGDAPRP
ncbi:MULTISPECIES: LptA/OstA family protein [Aphanothece]|uniref:LptA/OstA family protein n=1 Tax=Aphanothece TaxID=1121 RepID=UPI00398F48E3